MELSATLQAKFKNYIEANDAKRMELEAIAAPYKRLIAEIEAEQNELKQLREMIAGSNYGHALSALYWHRGRINEYRSEEIRRIYYRLDYKTSTSREHGKSVSITIEARPELKKYKYTVTHTVADKSANGKTISIFENNYNDEIAASKSNYWNYKSTSEASADEKKLMIERWQCKTLEEAEAKAAELMKSVNNLLRNTKYYKKLVEMVSSEIDQLETVENIG